MKERRCEVCRWWTKPLDLPEPRRLSGQRRGFGICVVNSYVEHGPGVYRELHEWRSPANVCPEFEE
jgi:hypothetical protein